MDICCKFSKGYVLNDDNDLYCSLRDIHVELNCIHVEWLDRKLYHFTKSKSFN